MKIAFAGSFAELFVEPVTTRLSQPCEIVTGDESDITPMLTDTDVLVTTGFTKTMADAAPNLRLVQVPGAGIDRIDRDALGPATHLANVYGHEAGIAEFVIGSMIALSRSFIPLDARLRQGYWDSQWAIDREITPAMPELGGKTLGIIGFGHIGKAIARRAAAFNMRVCAVRRTPPAQPPEGVAFVGGVDQLDNVIRDADYLAITVPLSPETRDLIDERRLKLMKPTAYLINVARGEVVNESALYHALADGTIAGAAIDVWYRYPTSSEPALPATEPFHQLANVILSPHASGWTQGMLDARAELMAENIERIARGEPPQNAIK